MKLKFTFLCALILSANAAYSICFTHEIKTVFFSELYLGDNNWFIETNSNSYDNMYSRKADSMAISCRSGKSMVKKSVFEALKNTSGYFVLRSDSLDTPLNFDSQADTIKLIFYVGENNVVPEVYERAGVIYNNVTSSKTKAPSVDQSLIFDSYYCEISSYITNQPTPGAANILKVGENQLTGKNAPLACNPLPNGNAVAITIDAEFDQKTSLVAVYNMSGDEVYLRFLSGETSFEVDTQSFPAGMYIVALKNNQGTVMTAAFSVY